MNNHICLKNIFLLNLFKEMKQNEFDVGLR